MDSQPNAFSQPAQQLEHGMYNVIHGGRAGGGGGNSELRETNDAPDGNFHSRGEIPSRDLREWCDWR